MKISSDIAKKRLKELFAELEGLMPSSADGESCEIEYSIEALDPAGEERITEAGKFTLVGEMHYIPKNPENEQIFSLSLSFVSSEASEDEFECEAEKFKADTLRFFSELEGKNHDEYFLELKNERDEMLREKEEEKPPFDYKGFFIYGGLSAALICILLILANKILPAILK